MATCRACGADITWAEVVNEDDRVALETRSLQYSGPDRYRIVEYASPLKVARVAADYSLEAYPDHRLSCPGQR